MFHWSLLKLRVLESGQCGIGSLPMYRFLYQPIPTVQTGGYLIVYILSGVIFFHQVRPIYRMASSKSDLNP